MNKRHFYVIWSREGSFVRMGLEPYDPATDGAGCDVCDVYDEDSVDSHSPLLTGYAQPDFDQASELIKDVKNFYHSKIWPFFDGAVGIGDFYGAYQDKADSDDVYRAIDDTDIPFSDYPDLDNAGFLTCKSEAHWWRDFVDAEYEVRDILGQAQTAWDLLHRKAWDRQEVVCALDSYEYKMREVYADLCTGDHAIAEERMIEATKRLVEDINDIARDAGLLDVEDSNE